MKKILNIFVLLAVIGLGFNLQIPRVMAAVPSIENSTVSANQSADFSFSHTGTGSNLLAVVMISQVYGASTGIVGVTYGGNAMTRAIAGGANGMGYIYYYTGGGSGAPTGAQTVAVDVLAGSVGRGVKAVAVTITGANLTSPINVTESYSGASDNSIYDTITTTVADTLILDALGTNTGTNPTVYGTGHVSIQDGTHGGIPGIYAWGYTPATTAGAYTIGWDTTSQTNDLGYALAAIAPAAGTSRYGQPVILFE